MMADFKNKKKQKYSSNTKYKAQQNILRKKKKKLSEVDEEILSLSRKYSEAGSAKVEEFKDFPLSSKTKKGLENGKFSKPTDIQKQSLLLSLQGNDILGAAKTGSGKTLAFLIPVLELLFREKWTQLDGLGALIISPTRELAYQIFEVLKVVGKFHDFSAGLVIGGKHLREEAERINRTNIVICTPGRLLQHMDQTVLFHADNLQVLVLDEADRILDLGFKESMNAIIQNLPTKRQTFLFSATQTKSVKDLARLSLKNPMYISVHENAKHSTPTQLQQSFMVCELHEKLDVLWSFIKNHLKKKILVFLSSCKQVRFVYEMFRRLRPGNTVLCLHGAMQQTKRVAAYEAFCRKQNAVLFATDIAARGLDFPAVHWVIQMDCPEDANTYIHRVGRTARYEKDGEALLVLLPSEEEAMVKQLSDKKIPVERIRVNPKKMGSIQRKLESMCASEIQLKEFAKRAFMSYVKAVFFMSNKIVFDVKELDTDRFASSLGLAIAPRIRFLQKELQKQKDKHGKSEKTPLLDKLKKGQQDQELSNEETEIQVDSEGESGNDSDSESEASRMDNAQDTSLHRNAVLSRLKKKIMKSSTEQNMDVACGSFENESSSASESNSGSDIESDSQSESDNCENTIKPQSKKLKEVGVKVRTLPSMQESQSSQQGKDGKVDNFSAFQFGEGDDETDDLLVVKKKHVDLEEESSDEDIDLDKERQQGKKALTKAAMAKKILKKNLKVNTKITFDEEGEEVRDLMKKSKLDSDEEDLNGGISIEQAKKRMEQEDKVDREIYRGKIKEKHKEKRIQEKEKRRAEAERRKQKHIEKEAVAVLGGSDDDEDPINEQDSFHSDMEGNKSEASTEENSDVDSFDSNLMDDNGDSGSESEEDGDKVSDSTGESDSDGDMVEQMPDKSNSTRKRKVQEVHTPFKKKRNEDFNTGLSLMDDEEIALKLLQQ